jgi:hypothetical protein
MGDGLLQRLLSRKQANMNAAAGVEEPIAGPDRNAPAQIIKEFRQDQESNPDLEFVKFLRKKRPGLNIMDVARQLDEYAKNTGKVSNSSFVPPRNDLQFQVNNPESADW